MVFLGWLLLYVILGFIAHGLFCKFYVFPIFRKGEELNGRELDSDDRSMNEVIRFTGFACIIWPISIPIMMVGIMIIFIQEYFRVCQQNGNATLFNNSFINKWTDWIKGKK